jgi:hypothetical protein
MQQVFERSRQDVIDAPKFGKLYQIKRVHGDKWIAARCRFLKGELFTTTERITIIRGPNNVMAPSVNDFVFQDNGPNPTWALWKVRPQCS